MNKLIFFILLLIFLIGCKPIITSNVVKEYGDVPEVYFCIRDNCSLHANELMKTAKERLHCAFYDLNLEEMIQTLNESSKRSDTKLVMDSDNFINFSFSKKDPKFGLMHNKFCVVDDVVFTGSFNPTHRDNEVNNNNMVILHSKNAADAYEDEFSELWNNQFRKGARNPKEVYLNDKKFEILFCPDDWCANKVIYLLNDAKKSIYFMTFSFTHEKIADILIKKNKEIVVKGVVETSQNSKYSQYERVLNNSVDVMLDKNKANMHHKVFIIDESIVITGSFNPTMGGDFRNDENLLVIYDPEIARKYIEEFTLITS